MSKSYKNLLHEINNLWQDYLSEEENEPTTSDDVLQPIINQIET